MNRTVLATVFLLVLFVGGTGYQLMYRYEHEHLFRRDFDRLWERAFARSPAAESAQTTDLTDEEEELVENLPSRTTAPEQDSGDARIVEELNKITQQLGGMGPAAGVPGEGGAPPQNEEPYSPRDDNDAGYQYWEEERPPAGRVVLPE